MLEMEFFSSEENDRASVALRATSWEYYPLRVCLRALSIFTVDMDGTLGEFNKLILSASLPARLARLVGGAKMVVIRHGYKETLDLDLKGALSIQANRIPSGLPVIRLVTESLSISSSPGKRCRFKRSTQHHPMR